MFRSAVLLTLAALALTPSAALAQLIRPDLYGTNGNVNDMVVSGNTLYIGGEFTLVGRVGGSGVPLDATTGLAPSSYARVAGGGVRAVIQDGNGGWFIGGDFSTVGQVPRPRLAHILSDGTVSSWNPAPNSYPVTAMKVIGSTLYVGGYFTSIAGQSRNGVAAFDIPTETLTPWNPNFGNVAAMEVSGSTIYLAGGNTVSAVDAVTGTYTGWSATVSGGAFPSVNAVAVSGSNVYVGGSFTSINFQFRNNLAAVDAATAATTAWNPSPGAGVSALAVNGSSLYVGGEFTNISSQGRNRIAAFDVGTGNLTGWNPSVGGSANPTTVYAFSFDGSSVYVGGSFNSIGGQSRANLAALDLVSGLATSWNPSMDRAVLAIARSGSTVYAGGYFNLMGAEPRSRLAALDLITGQPTSFNPGVDNRVNALAISGSTLYVGGSFALLAGQPRNNLGAVDVMTGSATAFATTVNSQVNRLVVGGSTVYAAGSFTGIGGFARNFVAALDGTTGAVSPTWNPNPSMSSFINALLVDGPTVYIGGGFTTMGGQNRNNLAAVDAVTGAATSWDPGVGGGVSAIQLSGTTLYIGGDFTFAGGQPRSRLAALSTSTGLATSWNPGVSGFVYNLAVDGTNLYVGGRFGMVAGQTRSNLAAVDVNTASATPWDPVPSGGEPNRNVMSLVTGASTILVGGSFTAVDGLPNSYLAGIGQTTVGVPLPKPATGAWATFSPRPNPFHGVSDLEFSIAREARVTITIHDVAGREVARPADRITYPAGVHHARFDGSQLSSGIYLFRLRAGNQLLTRRMVLIP